MNNLWWELFSEFKIQHTTTPLYNPSSNLVEPFPQTLTAMLLTKGPGVQYNWDVWLNASMFAYSTTMSSSTGVTMHYNMFGHKETLPVDGVFPTPFAEKRTICVIGQGTCWKKDNVLTGV